MVHYVWVGKVAHWSFVLDWELPLYGNLFFFAGISHFQAIVTTIPYVL